MKIRFCHRMLIMAFSMLIFIFFTVGCSGNNNPSSSNQYDISSSDGLGNTVVDTADSTADSLNESDIADEIAASASYESTSGKIYYLSLQGDDDNDGSMDFPFETFEHALEMLSPGDTLFIREGVYTETVEITASCSGEEDNYITISAYAGEKVVFDGSALKAPTLMTLEGAAYIRVTGLEFTGAKGTDACGMMILPGTHHVIVSENSFHDIAVYDPYEYDSCANAILLLGESSQENIHDIDIYGNEFYDCDTGWSECISVTGNCSYINIISNTVSNTGNIGIDLSGNYGYCDDPSKDFPRDCLVYQNTVSDCVSPNATSYGIYVDGGQRIEIIENTVKNCSGGIEIGAEEAADEAYATSDILVNKNILSNNIENGITVGGYEKELGLVRNVTVSSNICENNGLNNAILTLSKCDGVLIEGNTFVNGMGDAAVVCSEFDESYTKNITFESNTYYNGHDSDDTCFIYLEKTYTAFDAWTKAAGEKNGVYGE